MRCISRSLSTHGQGPNMIEEFTNYLPHSVLRTVLFANLSVQELIQHLLQSGVNVVNAEFATLEFTGDCTTSNLERLTTAAGDGDLIIDVSGIRAIDLSKAVCAECCVPHISIPIITPIGAPASGLVILYRKKDEFNQSEFYNINLTIVFIDTAIIASAPTCYLGWGMADTPGGQQL